jgi:hypothetical protein
MKKLGFLLFVPFFIISCTKQEVVAPQEKIEASEFLYRDANIYVESFKVEQSKTELNIHFKTLYEKNIKKIEVMSGATESKLCSIYEVLRDQNSIKVSDYNFSTSAPNSSVSYYMIRYTLNNGDWGYTSLYKHELK